MCSPLPLLPTDVLVCILEDFVGVDVQGMSALDVALCNHQLREGMLAALKRININEAVAVLVHELAGYLTWISSRQVNVKFLVVDPHDIPPGDGDQRLSVDVMVPIQFLTFLDRRQEVPVHCSALSLTVLLCCCPMLLSVDCSGWPAISNEQFTALQCIRQGRLVPVQVLNLTNCSALDPHGLLRAADQLCGGLIILYCDVLDDESLPLLATVCCSLQFLQIAGNRISSADSILRFCAANAADLQWLVLRHAHDQEVMSSNVLITDLVLQDIARACPLLKGFICVHSRYCSATFADSLQHLLSHCPSIHLVELPYAQIHLTESSMGKVCDVTFYPSPLTALLPADLTALTLPMHSFSAHHGDMLLNSNMLTLLTNKVGEALVDLDISSTEDVQESILLSLLARCPNLTSLMLHCESWLTEDTLGMLPSYCPKLIVLSICCCSELITDSALTCMLQKYKPADALRHLSFDRSPALTDVTLLKVAELFPDLLSLGLEAAALTKEVVLDLIVSGKLRVKNIRCAEREWLGQQLKKAGFHHLPLLLSDTR